MRLEKYSKNLGNLLLAISILLLGGCDSVLLNPKGQIAIEQRSLMLRAFSAMLIVVIPVILMTVIFAWKYRISNVNTKYRPDWSKSNKVEVIVWTVPILIILFLGILTWKSTHTLDPSNPLASDVKPIEINVIALDWKWLFIYPEQGIATVNEIAFPKNVPVNFKVTSNSIMNSFFIPALGSQIYAMAGMQTKLHLVANEAGRFNGISSNFSGLGFSDMKFKAISTQDKVGFEQWVAKVKQAENTLMNMDDFEKVATPSENHPVEYFSKADPELFKQVIEKFMVSHSKKTDMSSWSGIDTNKILHKN